MAEVRISDEELSRVDALCLQLDPEMHHLTADLVAEIAEPERRAAVLDYFRAALRAELIAGLLARAVGRAAVEHGIASKIAARSEVNEDFSNRYESRIGLRVSTWSHNFGRINDLALRAFYVLASQAAPDPGKIPPLLPPVPKEVPLMQAFWSLLDSAHDALFDSVDDELRLLTTADDE